MTATANAQLVLDLEGSQTMDVPFGEWVRSLPATPWWHDEEEDTDG